MESVADLEFGVHGFRHLEVPLTQMQEPASAVGLPRHQDAGALRDVVGVKGVVEDVMGGLAVGGVMLQEVLPVAEAHTASQQRERCRVGGAVALHVAPDALEGGVAQRVLASHGNRFSEKGEIGGCGDIPSYGLLNHLAQSGNFIVVGFSHRLVL